MNPITKETRRESYDVVLTKVGKKHKQCLENLAAMGQATANELEMYMHRKGLLPYFSRNFVQPRLNELVKMKKVEVVGKKHDSITDRTCAVYKVKAHKENDHAQ